MDNLIEAIELHDVEGIRACFEQGINPNDNFKGKPLIFELISEYTRTLRFKDCVKVFIDYGLTLEDKILEAVLLDDSIRLGIQLKENPAAISTKYNFKAAYTPLYEVTLLHICAEFNHISCAKVLSEFNADIDAKAGIDEYGFGGQTPIFHTVNQNSNQSFEMLNFLLANSADLKLTVPGLIWGKGYDWETLIPAVNPISYAMMGLLPQMHRNEVTIFSIVSLLLKEAYNIDYLPANIPCKYLK